MKIEIEYDGKYPNLCSGRLIVIIDNVKWEFPEYCLSSGGSAVVCGEIEEVVDGEWDVERWPSNFPEDLKEITLEKINSTIPWGCCGGCI